MINLSEITIFIMAVFPEQYAEIPETCCHFHIEEKFQQFCMSRFISLSHVKAITTYWHGNIALSLPVACPHIISHQNVSEMREFCPTI